MRLAFRLAEKSSPADCGPVIDNTRDPEEEETKAADEAIQSAKQIVDKMTGQSEEVDASDWLESAELKKALADAKKQRSE